jgi:protein involved in polysaccharide export with SLBB domain
VGQALPERYGWEDVQGAGVQSRVIKIPKDKLYGGDPRYNIIVKPGDTITVQLDVVGEFYVLGNVTNQGIINLTGRPMTLKMAIAAAGGLGQLAWPKKCEVIRRIGEKKEEIVMIDLEKIANGTQPDFFIKPNDVINVGTHGLSRWLAVLRNAFRATYGFGFVYDRNFEDRAMSLGNPGAVMHNSATRAAEGF